MNSQLIADIFARVQRYFETGDAAGLLDDAVTVQSADLAAIVLEGNLADIEVIPLLLLVHLTRYQLLPHPANQYDLQKSLELVTLLDVSNRSELVAPEVRIALQHAMDDNVMDTAAALVKTGNDALGTYKLTGDVSELADAIEQYQLALDALPAGAPSRAPILSNLGNAFQVRFRRTGNLSDLEDAIHFGRVAVDTLPADHPSYATCLSNLGSVLQLRFLQAGQRSDLDDAIEAAVKAVKANTGSTNSRALHLSNLVNALRLRFERAGQLEDLNDAIRAARHAVEIASTSKARDHLDYQCNLSLVLFRRYEQTGMEADLDEAVDIIRKVATAVGPEHPNFASYKSNLGNMLRQRARRTQSPAELNEAVEACKLAVSTTSPEHPSLSARLFNLGAALRERFELGGDHADHTDAIESLRHAASVAAGVPVVRITAARAWGALAAEKGDDTSAAEALSAAVSILPSATWHGLDRVTREYHLSNAAGLAADAAASALNVGEVGRAVELLDQGRSVLWLSLLHIRTDLSDLARVTPTLAARLDEIRRVLDLASAAAYSVEADEASMSDLGPNAGRDRM
ncbi:tetratricopeptide repeat protein [Amycolatopsis echigonensis]|nr:tetratricopeptide repeat protein [Amycolatopsis niigatensis]